jgi:hypothetical protein
MLTKTTSRDDFTKAMARRRWRAGDPPPIGTISRRRRDKCNTPADGRGPGELVNRCAAMNLEEGPSDQ